MVWRFRVKADSLEAVGSREKRASIGIAFSFLLVAIVVIVQSTIHLANHVEPEETQTITFFAWSSASVFFVLSVIKFVLSHYLDSISLNKDAVSSLTVAMASIGIIVSSYVFYHDPEVWYIDAIVALVIAAFLLVYGMYTLIKERRRQYWTKQFWMGEEVQKV